MRTAIKKTKVYKFKELSEEGQNKAIENYYDINIDYQWYLDDDLYSEIAGDYGLKINMKEISFDLDRGQFVYFDTYNHGRVKDYKIGIEIVDYDKFIKTAGLKLNKRLKEAEFSIDHTHYAGSDGKNYIDFYNADLTPEEKEKLENCLEAFIDTVLTTLKGDYEGRTDKEAIIDTLEVNEYEFTEAGKIYS